MQSFCLRVYIRKMYVLYCYETSHRLGFLDDGHGICFNVLMHAVSAMHNLSDTVLMREQLVRLASLHCLR
jgi:hypothetical protein